MSNSILKSYIEGHYVSWQQRTSINSYNKPVYAAAASIEARKETGFKLIRNKEGKEVVSTAWIITETAISEGDKIDGYILMAVQPQKDLDDDTVGYEGYM